MSKEIHGKIIILALTALLTGCPIASITADHVTQPVMLGKIKKIGGSENECGGRKKKFDIKVEEFRDAPYKAEADLLKLIDSPKDEVLIEKIYFVSGGDFGIWTGLAGSICEDKGSREAEK